MANIIFINPAAKGKIVLRAHFPGLTRTTASFIIDRQRAIKIEHVKPSIETVSFLGANKLLAVGSGLHIGYTIVDPSDDSIKFFNLAGVLVANLNEIEKMSEQLNMNGIVLTDKNGMKAKWDHYPRNGIYNEMYVSIKGKGMNTRITRVIHKMPFNGDISLLGLNNEGWFTCKLGKKITFLMPEQLVPGANVSFQYKGFTAYKSMPFFPEGRRLDCNLINDKREHMGYVCQREGGLYLSTNFSGETLAEIKRDIIGSFDLYNDEFVLTDIDGNSIKAETYNEKDAASGNAVNK